MWLQFLHQVKILKVHNWINYELIFLPCPGIAFHIRSIQSLTLSRSRDISVIVTWLPTRPGRPRDASILHSVQTRSGARQVFYPNGATHHLAPRLVNTWGSTSIPPYVFMAWRLSTETTIPYGNYMYYLL
jgi:hypothetical protein